MRDKKQSIPMLCRATLETFRSLSILAIVDRLEKVLVTVAIWGWLPLSLANWILRKGKVKKPSKCRASAKTSKHSNKVV